VKPWRGVWPATKPGSKCLQYDPVMQAGTSGLARLQGDEDCLYLNVYSPMVCAENSSILSVVHVGWCLCYTAHMGNRRPAGRMRPSLSFDPALIHFSELTHIKLTSYHLRKTHHVFSHQGLFCDSSKFGYRFKTLFSL
jgi:hypothetical protein